MENNRRDICTTRVFKTDLSELCSDCPFRNEIKKGLENRLIPEYTTKSKFLDVEELDKFFNSELDSALKSIKEMHDYELNNESEYTYKPNRSSIAIWNCERAKLVKEFQKQLVAKESSEKNESSKFSMVNNFNHLDPQEVYNYFHKSLVEKGYLDGRDLEDYLISAFQDTSRLDVRINFRKLNRSKITNVFYEFYKTISGKPHGHKKQYAELLGENFVGFNTHTLMSNFSK